MLITSLENQQVKYITSLHKKKYRDEFGKFFIEGIKSINEAVNFKKDIVDSIFYSPEIFNYNLDLPAAKVTTEIMCKICDTVTPQGIIAVCNIPEAEMSDVKNAKRIVYLDRVQDPGNVGTIIRTADAFGFDAVILSKECADVYSPKVVRSTMGSLFHIPIVRDVDIEAIKALGIKVYASSLDGNEKMDDIAQDCPFALVIGNEGQGISNAVKQVADSFVKIDMSGDAESLNASIAAGILMYCFKSPF